MLVLCDLDGTLLTCAGAGGDAFAWACSQLLQREVTRTSIPFAGGTDPMLFQGVCERFGVPASVVLQQQFRALYVPRLQVQLQGAAARLLPGASALIDALEHTPGVTLGMLTGNYAAGADLKLAAVGVDPCRFAVRACGDDGATRRDLPPVALARYRALRGMDIPAQRVVIVGDTPKDIDCALAHGCRVVAVATGVYRRDELIAAGADRVLDDLRDVARAVASILG